MQINTHIIDFINDIIDTDDDDKAHQIAGTLLERVQRVQLHPSILRDGCMHLSIFSHEVSRII